MIMRPTNPLAMGKLMDRLQTLPTAAQLTILVELVRKCGEEETHRIFNEAIADAVSNMQANAFRSLRDALLEAARS